MRIVLDTNSLVGALVRPRGSSGRILDMWRRGDIELVASPATLAEARLVLGAGWLARVVGEEAVRRLLDELADRAVMVEPEPVPNLGLKDRGDHDLVEAAVAAGAYYVVTADREVLMHRGHADVRFVTPPEFLAQWKNGR
ncbi:MAG: putative toxin-antitoxin system toxin component, PIN family [Dehalococcoidia bacterium]